MVSKNNSPLVSVVIPAYNAGKFLERCIDSVVAQTYHNKELIIIDDCSMDNSFEIAKRYAEKYSWITAIKNQNNLGVADTFNAGISKSKGDLIARMDADDVMFPDRLEKQVEYISANPDTVILGGQCKIIDRNDNVIGQKTFPQTNEKIKKMMFSAVPMQQPTIMINRRLVPEDKLVSKKRFSPAEDYDLFFSLTRYGKLANLTDYTLYYREHGTNISLVKPKFTFWRIQDARFYAILHYGYRPPLFSLITVILQTIAILILPEKLIYPLHKLTRKMNK